MSWMKWNNWQKASSIIGVLSGGIALMITASGGVKASYNFLFPSPPWENAPITLTLEGVLPARTQGTSQKFIVERTNDHHKTFGTHVKCYDLAFKAKKGFSIFAHSWTEHSATRVSDFSINNDGGSDLDIHFCLKAGPKTDRYRGWLKGVIITKETRKVPQSLEKISTITIDKSGEFLLPNQLYSKYSEIKLVDINSDFTGSAKIGEKMRWGETCGVLTVAQKTAGTVLQAHCE